MVKLKNVEQEIHWNSMPRQMPAQWGSAKANACTTRQSLMLNPVFLCFQVRLLATHIYGIFSSISRRFSYESFCTFRLGIWMLMCVLECKPNWKFKYENGYIWTWMWVRVWLQNWVKVWVYDCNCEYELVCKFDFWKLIETCFSSGSFAAFKF